MDETGPARIAGRPGWNRRGVLGAAGGLVLGSGRPARAGDEVLVRNLDELRAALASDLTSSTIVLANGSYAGDPLRIASGGRRDRPLVLRAAEPLGATLHAGLLVGAPFVTLAGLRFEDARLVARERSITVQGCLFTNWSAVTEPQIVVTGEDAVFERCEVGRSQGRGISVAVAKGARRTRISRCYFHDFGGVAKEDVFEPVQLGQSKSSTDIDAGCTVEGCLFERCNLDTRENEAISIKSSGNIVRACSFVDARQMSIRHGQNNTVVSCWFEGRSGIHVYDRGNRVFGNVLVAGDPDIAIRVMAGDVSPEDWPANGRYPAAFDTLLAGNVGPLKVGFRFNKRDDVPATGTLVAAQKGPIDLLVQRDTVEDAPMPRDLALVAATRVDVSMCGPDAR